MDGSPHAKLRLDDFLDQPGDLVSRLESDLDHLSRRDVEAFQLAAAQRKLKRQADRLPIVAEMLDGKDPSTFEQLDDFIPILFDEDAYKSYEPALLDNNDFTGLTQWLDRYTTQDLSGVDMEGCTGLTDWCVRLDKTADIFICHSSGTSGTLSFVPRSRRDRDWVVDNLAWRNPSLLSAHEKRDVTFFTMGPRKLYRITQVIFDGLEDRYLTNPVQCTAGFHSPEFHMAQGRLRKAAAKGTMDAALKDPIVAANKDAVEQYQSDLPMLVERWTNNLIENYRGKKIFFQGSFDKAWQITQHFQKAGVKGAFAPESVFALAGGVKDSRIAMPSDWLEQFIEATGVSEDNLVSNWGMSEITGGVPRCSHGQYHFPIAIIPFLVEPHTRRPLPRSGVQTGQIGLLELNSDDCWGGLFSGDRGTIDWDSVCGCGRDGPLLHPDSIGRL